MFVEEERAAGNTLLCCVHVSGLANDCEPDVKKKQLYFPSVQKERSQNHHSYHRQVTFLENPINMR